MMQRPATSSIARGSRHASLVAVVTGAILLGGTAVAHAQVGVRVGNRGVQVRTGRGIFRGRTGRSTSPANRAPASPANRAPPGTIPTNRAPGVPASAFQQQQGTGTGRRIRNGRVRVPPGAGNRPIILRGGVIYGQPACDPPYIVPVPVRDGRAYDDGYADGYSDGYQGGDCYEDAGAAGAIAPSTGGGATAPTRSRVYRPRYPRSRVPELDGAPTATPVVRQPFEFAVFALRNGRYEEAVDAFRQAMYAGSLPEGPGRGSDTRRTIRVGLGLAYLGMGRHGAAEVAFRAAIETEPGAALDLDALLRAVFDYAPEPDLLELGESPPRSAFLRGVLALLSGDGVLAGYRLDEQVRRDPLDRDAAVLRAAVMERTGMAPPKRR